MEPVERFTSSFELDPDFIYGIRSAEYLNWRFVDNPMHDYSVYEFFEKDSCIGYCVYSTTDSRAEIFDFVTTRRRRGCLRLLIDHCRSEHTGTLSFEGSNLGLGTLGFVRRRSTSFFTASDSRKNPFMPKGRWYVTPADSDH
jgi:hypothetical protein